MPARIMMVLALLGVAVACGGCAGVGSAPRGHGTTVVAAESTWGTVAAALAGGNAQVTSIIANPAQDPHSYEPEAADARAFAQADIVIINGLGYDTWASRLAAADAPPGRVVINVGALLHLPGDANPHRWYSPSDVGTVADAISATLTRIAPSHATAYRAARTRFDAVDLAAYHRLIAAIQTRYAHTPVGASESIFAPLASALGLDLVTPGGLLRAVSDGGEVTSADMSTAQSQIAHHTIRVWVLNTQNETPTVNILTQDARAAGIPVVEVTETPHPSDATFASWQTTQLINLARALQRAPGRTVGP